ncbi:MAG: hypothetical protein AAF589_01050 [Planctomycetota bacterium]
MKLTNRMLLTVVGSIAFGFAASWLFNLTIMQAMLAATPVVLMLGSMATLFYLAKNSDKIDAKSQLATLLIVEFGLVPLGAGIALVAFFVIRAQEVAPLP